MISTYDFADYEYDGGGGGLVLVFFTIHYNVLSPQSSHLTFTSSHHLSLVWVDLVLMLVAPQHKHLLVVVLLELLGAKLAGLFLHIQHPASSRKVVHQPNKLQF